MQKVVIYTIYGSNYGAILQAYALQRYIKDKYSVDVYMCNPNGTPKIDILSKKYTPNKIKNLIIKFVALLRYKALLTAHKRKEQFKKREFKECTHEESMNCKIHITGSDQVFNPDMENNHIFFQDIPKNGFIKVAYAPSFGIKEFSDEFKERVTPLLKDFDYLSCREESGTKFLKEEITYAAQHVCDPTLLLTSDEWNQVAITPKEEEYIFVYDLNGDQPLIDIALKLKERYKLPIVCQTQKPQRFYKGVDNQVYSSGPQEFVGFFKNAKFVVTDSFHGMMFSLIFRKQFYIYIAVEGTSSRIREVLDKLNLTNRIIKSANSFTDVSNEETDYGILEKFISESKLFIHEFMEKL